MDSFMDQRPSRGRMSTGDAIFSQRSSRAGNRVCRDNPLATRGVIDPLESVVKPVRPAWACCGSATRIER